MTQTSTSNELPKKPKLYPPHGTTLDFCFIVSLIVALGGEYWIKYRLSGATSKLINVHVN